MGDDRSSLCIAGIQLPTLGNSVNGAGMYFIYMATASDRLVEFEKLYVLLLN